MFKLKRLVVVFAIVISLLVVSVSADWSTTDSNNLVNIKTNISLILGYVDVLDSISGYLLNIKSDVSTVKSYVDSVENLITNTNFKLDNLNTNLTSVKTAISSLHSDIEVISDQIGDVNSNLITIKTKVSDISSTTLSIDSGIDLLNDGMVNLRNGMDQLVDFFVSEEDKALKDETKDDTVAATDVMRNSNYVSNAGMLGTFQNSFFDYFMFGADADFSEMFTYADQGYSSWFSQTTFLGLCERGGQSMTSGVMTADYVEPDTPLLDANMNYLRDQLGLE